MKKLNNKGFTLVEILAVVAIIAIVGLIAVPSVLSVINTGKNGSYDLLVKNIKTASISLYEEVVYMDANLYHYSADGIKEGNIEVNDVDGSIEINLQTLVRNGFLSGNNDDDNQKKILNPKNNEDIGGCRIKIIKTTSGNEVTYTIESLSTEEFCPSTNDYALKKEKEEDNKTEDSEENTEASESLEDKALLSTANIGSYVEYVGSNGCSGDYCKGKNANSDSGNGYCFDSYYEFNSSGWRIAYIDDNGNVYLVSAGSPECISTYVDNKETSNSITLDDTIYYSSSYTFYQDTGIFTLDYAEILDIEKLEVSYDSPIYTCNYTYASSGCSTLYEIYEMTDDTTGLAYKHTSSYEETNDNPLHIKNLNNKALKYCNKAYADGGVCNSTTTWAMNGNDLEKMTGYYITESRCYGSVSIGLCTNELTSIGGYYWFATADVNNTASYYWYPNYSSLSSGTSNNAHGLRPVIKLDESIVITGGTGDTDNPYIIAKK